MNVSRVVGTALLLGVLASGAAAQVGHNHGLLNPNLATRAQLTALPGLHEAAVDAILQGRPFLDMLSLNGRLLEAGVDPETLPSLYRGMFIPLNLNTAPRSEILLVPGVGPRMAHEFEEYRPYVALAQWRREMGKYVDAAEVARMEAYVFVPVDLNTASDQDILSIPGVGPRLLREFKEYRPYRAMGQFRREIGKYVDAAEVARLERYVTIRQ